ncbi:hypothetical protein AVEN_177516-1 [Araneus ventricosus]|uniref:Uncharacterized protein n=1 Tax=Araneus ventricosus TaxID=182803 RepID=A0A4Y2D2Q9_ARAVE|nr:hypothetical protein AVEN_177516-1 [Araneus ventricosus]
MNDVSCHIFLLDSDLFWGLQWPSGKVSASRPEGSRLEPRFHLGSACHGCLVYIKFEVLAQTSSRCCGAEILRVEVSSQVSSSSSDRGSKLRCPPQKKPRVASKRVVNIKN